MVNTIFLGIAVVASAIFLIQFIMSIFFGDLDTDTDIDVDLSSAVSFKGLTHFCIGFGWYMYIAKSTAISTFLIGILIGLLFVFILWFLYKKAYQLQKKTNRKRQKPWWAGNVRSMHTTEFAISFRSPRTEPCVRWKSVLWKEKSIRPATVR